MLVWFKHYLMNPKIAKPFCFSVLNDECLNLPLRVGYGTVKDDTFEGEKFNELQLLQNFYHKEPFYDEI